MEKLQLEAAIYNAEKMIEIYEFIASTNYSGQFNKRYQTYLDKMSSEKFGTQVYPQWGMNGEDKIFPLVNFGMTRDEFSDEAKYRITFYYKGQAVDWDTDKREYRMREKSESDYSYSITSANDYVKAAKDRIEYLKSSLAKFRDNLAHIDDLKAEHDKVEAIVKAYNDKLSWPISDRLRIK